MASAGLTRKQKEHVRAVLAQRASVEMCWDTLYHDWRDSGLDPEDPALTQYAGEVEDRIQRFLGDPRHTLI